MTEKDRNKKTMFIIVGLVLMVFTCLMVVFIEVNVLRLTALTIIFLIGFGCCVAGTENRRES